MVHFKWVQRKVAGHWSFVKSLWNIFRDSLARRPEYERVADTVVFPSKFCSHGLVEDEQVAERALQVWPNVLKMFPFCQSLAKSKRSTCKSYGTLIDIHKNRLKKPIKLRLFKSFAAKLKAFLKEFQNDFPMLPFLAKSLDSLLRGLMKPYVLQAALNEANTLFKLSKIDIKKK